VNKDDHYPGARLRLNPTEKIDKIPLLLLPLKFRQVLCEGLRKLGKEGRSELS